MDANARETFVWRSALHATPSHGAAFKTPMSDSCRKRRVLMEEYAETVVTYSAIAHKCLEGSWSADFNESFRRLERARINCEVARLELESHIAEHECQKRSAAKSGN